VNQLARGLSVSLVLALVASVFVSSPVVAAEEARYEVESTRDAYISVTSVMNEYPDVPLFVAQAPVTVTFHGDTLCREYIEYYSDGAFENGILHLPDFGEPVRFEVKNYTYFGETEVYDELTEEMWDIGVYVTGNYATLTDPGFYLVLAGPEAAAPTMIYIQVVDSAPGEATEEPAAQAEPEPVSATPTTSRVLVDGKEVAFGAYNIGGYNYFKLRDLAMALSGTEKQFEVTWDGEKNAINLVSGLPYTAVGGELTVPEEPTVQQAIPTTSTVLVNGAAVQVTAYNIGGFNYFKLRDVAKAIDFGVTWDGNTNSIGIDPTSPYTG